MDMDKESQPKHSTDAEAMAASAELIAKAERQRAVTRVLNTHMFLNVTVLCLPIQARPIIIKKLTRGDAGKTAAILATLTSSVGMVEFLVNPVIGRLSDACGRKPFLLLSPFASLSLKLLVWRLVSRAANKGGGGGGSGASTARLLAIERIVCGALTTVGGSTLCQAVLADVFEDQSARAAASAVLGSWAGIGVILGPWLGGQVMARWPTRPSACFGAAAALAAVQLAYVSALLPETLPHGDARRRRMDWSAVSPLAFLRLFRGSKTLSKLAAAAGLMCVPEGKNISDLNQVYLAEDVGFGNEARTRWLMCFGLSMILGGRLAPRLLRRVGVRSFTALANGCTAGAFSLWATVPRGWAVWLGLVLLLPGMERRAAIGSVAVDHAVASGMGRGEYAAAFANFRALMVVSAPLLYGKAYAWCARLRKSGAAWAPPPGAAYFVGVAAVAVAQGLLAGIPDSELFRFRKREADRK